jgi:hypothetical protein
MADFSVQSTNLPAPQAGYSPLPTVTTGALDNGVGQLLNSIGDIYAKGIGLQKKDEAQKLQTSVVGNYASQQNDLNTAFSTGQITANEMNIRSRKLYSQQVASFPQFADELNKVASGFGQHSALTDAEAQIKQEQAQRQTLLTQAASEGYGVIPGMTQAQEDAVIKATQAGKAAQREFTQVAARSAEARAQGTYDQSVINQQTKETTSKLLTGLAGANIEALRASGEALISQAVKDPANFQQYSLQLQGMYGNIQAQINSAAAGNPELAGTWRTLFDEQYKLQAKLMDPKENKDLAEAELKGLLARTQLAMVTTNPRMAAVAASSALLGQNAPVALKAVPEARDAILHVLDNPPSLQSPKVVGGPGEAQAIELASQGVKAVNSSGVPGTTLTPGQIEKMAKETKNINENILTQYGTYLGGSYVDPKAMKSVTAFVASPEFGAYVTANPMSKAATDLAAKAFKANYVPTVRNSIQDSLTSYLDESGGAGVGKRGNPARLLDTVDFVPSSAGIQVVPKAGVTLDAAGRADQSTKLKEVGTAINLMVKAGAHFEGTTDYAKYWENNKHILLPSAYPAKAGSVMEYEGKKYTYLGKPGLTFYDRANWQPVKD